jgi:hypothetical protein
MTKLIQLENLTQVLSRANIRVQNSTFTHFSETCLIVSAESEVRQILET